MFTVTRDIKFHTKKKKIPLTSLINVCYSSLSAKNFFTLKRILRWNSYKLINTGPGQCLVHTAFVSIFLHLFSGNGTTCHTLICLHILLRDAQRIPQPVVSDSADGLCQEKEQNNFKQQRWNGAVLWRNHKNTFKENLRDMSVSLRNRTLGWKIELASLNSPRLPLLCSESAAAPQSSVPVFPDRLTAIRGVKV